LIEHFITPFLVVRQQVTKPGFPQVERAAHRLMAPENAFGAAPALMLAFTACATHFT
jgi:hypothetical protein